MKRLFGARGSGKLINSKGEIEEHFRKSYSDDEKNVRNWLHTGTGRTI